MRRRRTALALRLSCAAASGGLRDEERDGCQSRVIRRKGCMIYRDHTSILGMVGTLESGWERERASVRYAVGFMP